MPILVLGLNQEAKQEDEQPEIEDPFDGDQAQMYPWYSYCVFCGDSY
jgi:hypothetical protein